MNCENMFICCRHTACGLVIAKVCLSKASVQAVQNTCKLTAEMRIVADLSYRGKD